MSRRRAGVLLEIELQILRAGALRQATEGSFYGFRIARDVSTNGTETLSANGTVYKALQRLVAAGYLEEFWEDADIAVEGGRPRRRLYQLTEAGMKAGGEASSDSDPA